eukprot:COSAG01_NODE_18465_length_1074_cov_1.065641_1_plen_286_part_10
MAAYWTVTRIGVCSPGRDVTFVCNDGWYMSHTVNGKCRTSDGHYDVPTCTECSDVPHCPEGDPASHGGHGKRCTSASDQHCDEANSCDPGYTKDVHCNPVAAGCENDPCGPHGLRCTPGVDGRSHTCTCKSGWKNDQTCNDPTGCDSQPCGEHGDKCTPGADGSSHTCTCLDGWKNDQTCNDPTGCDRYPCGPDEWCNPVGGSHTCTVKCAAGKFSNSTSAQCTECLRGQYAEDGSADHCQACPPNSDTPGVTGSTSVTACRCKPGYIGTIKDTQPTSKCDACPIG